MFRIKYLESFMYRLMKMYKYVHISVKYIFWQRLPISGEDYLFLIFRQRNFTERLRIICVIFHK